MVKLQDMEDDTLFEHPHYIPAKKIVSGIIDETCCDKDNPYVGIKHDGKGWDIRLENHELVKTAWAINASSAYDKAKIIADYIGCNIIWKSKLDENGGIIQLSEPEQGD